MQNVPEASLTQAQKVEFSQVNSGSTNGMSNDLFGEFLAYHAREEQASYAPAPDLDSFARSDSSSTQHRVDSTSFTARTTAETAAAAATTAAATAAATASDAADEHVSVAQQAGMVDAPPKAATETANAIAEQTGKRPHKSKERDDSDESGQSSDKKNKSKAAALLAGGSVKAKGSSAKSGANGSTQASTGKSSGKSKEPKAEVDMDDMRDVAVTLEDLEGMKDQLLQYGLTEEQVEALMEQAGSPQGLTWGKLVAYISKQMDLLERDLELSASQQQQLMTFFQKLGFNASDAESMVAEVGEGNVDHVLATLERHIKSMDQEQLMALDPDEVKAFLKELRQLKASTEGRKLGMVRVVSQAMDKAVDRVREQYVENNQADLGQDGAKKDGQPVVNTKVADAARLADNMTAEQAAGAAEANAQRIVKVLDARDQAKVAVDQVMDKAAESVQQNGSDSPTDHLLQQETSTQDQNKDPWSEFMGKMRQEQDAKTQQPAAKNTAAAEILNAKASDSTKETLTTALNQTRENFNATLEKLDAPKVMRQVQDGILRNLGQGRKQITLQLEPAQLGKLSIILTSNKGGEVQATIRADNHESAKIIADNLDSIRQHMENQGIKVSKLEVQTQLSQYQGNEWHGEAGHNQAQEQEAQARFLNRWRTLKNSDGMDSAASEAAVTAARQSLNGGTGLHVIA